MLCYDAPSTAWGAVPASRRPRVSASIIFLNRNKYQLGFFRTATLYISDRVSIWLYICIGS
ncbi:hypothetical protein T492DRAFT_943167 [Pavlovales sp. CCMP2436]|nr:hypothetical protein T492DRAFT_943167 [Pavlovales sp. CCMP2436]